MKINNTICRNATLLAALLVSAAQASASTIYEDTFSGSAIISLNGAAPTTRPGSETWAFNNATALNGFMADGTAVATGGGVNGQISALLPFSPLAGNIYQLSGRISLTTATGQWVGLGFSDALTTAHSTSGLFAFSALNGISWALHGDLGANSLQAFAGPDTANLVANTFSVNPTDLRILFDTTGAQWTTTFFVTTANLNSGNEIQVGSTFAYGANPAILGVGFTKGQDVGGIIDNFKLEVIPEPTSMTLALLGGLSLLIAAKRRSSATR